MNFGCEGFRQTFTCSMACVMRSQAPCYTQDESKLVKQRNG
jgi:hypothetical protein